MPTSSSHSPSLHARSIRHDLEGGKRPLPIMRASRTRHIALLVAVGLGLGLAVESLADARGRGSGGRSVKSRSATVRPAPTRSTPTPRYRNYGRVRGGTGQAPVKQLPLVPTLSGIPPQSFRVRPHGSTPVPRHRQFAQPIRHHAPQVIYVPVGYGLAQPRQEPVIYVQAPPAPPPVVVVAPQPGVAPSPAGNRQPSIPPPPPAPPARTSNEPGVLRIEIQPADAEVYLDDRPLAIMIGGHQISTAPGIHVLEVTHPDYTAERLVFAVNPEQTHRVAIDLRESKPGRRTRID